MVDVVNRATRSRMMAGIRGKNTKPELFVRCGVFKRGFRFRLHVRNLPGRPDLVFARYKVVIFVHGCFWHGHDCRFFKAPRTNAKFWRIKIGGNRRRDVTHAADLLESGWRVMTVWECALRGKKIEATERIISRIVRWLDSRSKKAEIRGL